MIRKVLIANRGEIALRIIRTLRDMNIESVAVYSEADRTARYVRLADEAYCIGPPPSSESYLAMDRIVETAKKAGADAVHPGYGFLSENAAFSELCRDSGLIFIGPPADAIRSMGEKTQARRLMEAAGVPVVPGTLNALADADEAAAKAEEIGYPVMLKAAAGGGGKGMRLVSSSDNIASAFRDAASEAESAFGDASVYIEKAVIRPRHIEMQIIGDTQGNVIWLGERECSIQRRHQKVIEEAPSAFVTEDMRRKMGEVAVRAAKAVNYFNAGTIEFLVDADRNFYFMEMNTRLQVEHAVTEDVTGLDLVRHQILVADGQPLSFKQEDVAIRGWSIEARIYAEDPYAGFMPSPGKIVAVRLPEGPNVRVDSAVFPGAEISLYYDPMVAKVVTRGSNRKAAVDVMRRALEEFQVVGIQTNRHFLQALVNRPAFEKGELNTDFIPQFLAEKTFEAPANSAVADITAAIYAYESSRRSSARESTPGETGIGAWRRAMDPWRG